MKPIIAPSLNVDLRESRLHGVGRWCSSFLHGCPCGYHGDPVKECTCTVSTVDRYKKRISGPLLDRIDLFVEVPRVDYEKLVTPAKAEGSAQVCARIEAARRIQQARFDGTGIIANAEMGPVEVWKHCQMQDAVKGLMQAAMKQMNLSARGFHRILKLSCTIADLAGSDAIAVSHLAEALQYRPTGWG